MSGQTEHVVGPQRLDSEGQASADQNPAVVHVKRRVLDHVDTPLAEVGPVDPAVVNIERVAKPRFLETSENVFSAHKSMFPFELP